eukprot:m51a1_g13408 hypothetical protein (138) ;mRNA; r:68009-68422
MKDLNVQYLAAQEELQRLTAKVASAATAAGPVAGQQQDEVVKSLQAARAKLKEKIAVYKKDLHKVTNDLRKQHVLIAMLKSQNEELKEQLELLKSERANWREYEPLKGSSTTSPKHNSPSSHPGSGSADGAADSPAV